MTPFLWFLVLAIWGLPMFCVGVVWALGLAIYFRDRPRSAPLVQDPEIKPLKRRFLGRMSA